jgi:hypothetical protein
MITVQSMALEKGLYIPQNSLEKANFGDNVRIIVKQGEIRLLSISGDIYWHNIGFNEQDWWQYVKTNNVLSCINPEQKNATYCKGDTIIAYANEYGALGWGIITKDTTYKKIEEGSVEDVKNGTHLYRLKDLEWQCVANNIEDGIKGGDVLSEFNIHHPLSAFSRITKNEEAELLIQELENKFNSI